MFQYKYTYTYTYTEINEYETTSQISSFILQILIILQLCMLYIYTYICIHKYLSVYLCQLAYYLTSIRFARNFLAMYALSLIHIAGNILAKRIKQYICN
jgi:hypothetical protein